MEEDKPALDGRLELAVDNMAKSEGPDMKLESNIILREEVVRGLLDGSVDPKVASAAKGLLDSNDKVILVKQKMQQDKEVEGDRTEVLKDLYKELVTTQGRDIDLGEMPVAKPEDRELNLEDMTFNVDEGELITGDDTENSLEDN